MLHPWIFDIRSPIPQPWIFEIRPPMLKPISDANALDLRNQISVDHFDHFDTKAPGNLEPGPWNLEPGSWNLELGTWNLNPGTWNLEPGTWNLEQMVPGPGKWSADLENGPRTWKMSPGPGKWSPDLENNLQN